MVSLKLPLELPLCAAGPPSVAQSMPTALRSYATHRSGQQLASRSRGRTWSLVLLQSTQGQSEHECVASLTWVHETAAASATVSSMSR